MLKRIILLLMIFIIVTTSVIAEDNKLEYKPLTREEIGTEISIPNREGKWDTYANIDTFEKLYSVLEDLSVEYNDLLEEKWTLEGRVDELKEENEELRDQIHSFENEEEYQTEEKYSNGADKNSNIIGILITIIICLIIYIIILKDKSKNGMGD